MLHHFQQRTVKSRNSSHLHHRTIVPYFTLSPPQNSQKYNHSINFTEQSNLNLHHLHQRTVKSKLIPSPSQNTHIKTQTISSNENFNLNSFHLQHRKKTYAQTIPTTKYQKLDPHHLPQKTVKP